MRLYRKKAVHHLFGSTFSRWGRVPGRWVPWCVEHDTRGGVGSRYCDDPDSEPNSCRWHPQGAFIPDDEGGAK